MSNNLIGKQNETGARKRDRLAREMSAARYCGAVFRLLLTRLGIVIGLYTLCRILFFLFNLHLFEWVDGFLFIKLMVYGLRFDIAAVATLNAPFIVISLLPLRAVHRPLFQRLLFYLFVAVNAIALLSNCADIEYYRFINRRSTFHLFSFLFMGGDVVRLMPRFIMDFWYIAFIWFFLSGSLILGYRRLTMPDPTVPVSRYFYIVQPFVLLAGIGLMITAIRGGLQDTPITLKTAARMVDSRNIALVINSPFSIITTKGQRHIEEKAYFEPETLAGYFNPRHAPSVPSNFTAKNVVLFIMESFSKEYMGPPHGREGLTPFLDTLARQGLFCADGFANGTDSISGIPAVVAGMPSLMPEPFMTSPYAANRIDSLAGLLARKGYSTAFYHGAKRGSLNLDAFCYSSGFKDYFGLDDFADNDRYDGRWGTHDTSFVQQVGNLWGVHDDPFFQYALSKIHRQSEPFFAVVYSLSSHHPYTLPDEARSRYPQGTHPIHPAVRYADDALRHFFEKASEMPWYDNTLFVITADHTAQAGSTFYKSRVGRYAIPILFFCPGDEHLKGVYPHVAQQIDILPTVLEYLRYDQPYHAFGESLFNPNRHRAAISFQEDIYQLIQDQHVLHFDGEKSVALYQFETDPFLSNPLQKELPGTLLEMEKFCKSFIQTYNHFLIHNELAVMGDGSRVNK